ncbi:MAG TPA: pyridine nucleotide-disulfide oxidoreductase, partial [Stellaceae bacterium]
MNDLVLRHGLAFEDLYRRDGLVRLDGAFIAHLKGADVALHNRLVTARRDPASLDRKAESDLLVDLAPHLEDFIGDLFGIAPEIGALQARHDELAPVYTVKRLFVQRRAVKGVTPEAAAAIDGA